MIQDVEKRVKRLYLGEKPLISANNEAFRAKDIVYFYSEAGKYYAVAENDLKYELVQNFSLIEKAFDCYFLQVHRSFLVAVDRITAVFERYPESEDESIFFDRGGVQDECELELRGSKSRIPVTTTPRA